MQQVADDVSFSLSYIGQYALAHPPSLKGPPTADPCHSLARGERVECMHGPDECLGDIIELCAADLYPTAAETYLGFTMCLTQDYQHIPDSELVEACALEHDVDIDRLNGCVSDDIGFGAHLLRQSVTRSSQANVTKSCTVRGLRLPFFSVGASFDWQHQVRLDDEIWCIRDGGAWKDCPNGHEVRDLVRDIRTLSLS